MAEPVLELRGVSFGYSRELALEDVTVSVERGDFLGLVGPNGGGKTTILKIALGLLRPRSGYVALFGQPLGSFREWHRVGYVPQAALNFDLRFPATVAEVVAMGRIARRKLLQRAGKADASAIAEALETAGMAEYRDTPIGNLSAGQQQRVFIARALASQPELLVLDEPTTGVDAPSQDRFYALLRHLNREMGITLVMVSHDIGVVMDEVNRLGCLNKRLVYHGDPLGFLDTEHWEELYGHPVTRVTHHHPSGEG
ncbi:MAG: transporter ATP-binding protein [Dehalococcoidia bacterium]|nr:transporter ATP-binding protein [Dehalococcoidia bacterium]